MSKDKTAIVETPDTSVALADTLAQYAGSGFEEAGSEAYALPFLRILQANSPQVKRSDGAYIKGAEEGMLFNTVTNELYNGDEGIVVIPVHFTQRFVEWKTQEQGGGFVAEYLPSDKPATRKDERFRDILPNGHVLQDTRNHYVLIVKPDGSTEGALIAMSSTNLKKSRQWMSKMQGMTVRTANGIKQAPMFSRMYRVRTSVESNDKGTWFSYRIDTEGIVDNNDHLAAAAAFHESLRNNEVKVQHDKAGAAVAAFSDDDHF